MDGWVKIHRKMLEHPIVCKDNDHLAIWIYLLVNATHKEIPAMFQGQKIMLQPGQLITGRKSISEQLSVSESKVHRVLIMFENDKQIEQQTSNKNRIISIVNWHKYQTDEQQNEQQMNNKRTTNEQQLNTNKNVKNEKNVRMKELKDLKDIKTLYGDTVRLTDEEYQKLVLQHGEKFALDCIDTLDHYKGSSGKTYKSDYKAILSWVIDRVSQRKPQTNVSLFNPRTETSYERIKRMTKEAEENEAVGFVETSANVFG
jgi:hypothetical protein